METDNLIYRIKKNKDKDAVNELIKMYYNEIFAFVYKQILNRELSKDLCQDIFLKLLKGINKFDESKSSIRTYLYRIASNYVIDFFRTKKYKTDSNLEEQLYKITDSVDVLEELIKEEQIALINQSIERLSSEEQDIIRLRFYGEFSLQEISDIKDLNLQTVKNKLYNGLKKLKILMKECDKDE